VSGVLLTGAGTILTYGVPLGLLAVLIALWIAGAFDRDPPVLATVPPDREWIKTPLDRVDEGLRAGRLVPAIAATRSRVELELTQRFDLSARVPPVLWSLRRSVPEGAAVLLAADRELRAAQLYAQRVESVVTEDFVTRWRGPVWQQRSRELFASALDRAAPWLEGGGERS